ncbi:MAG: hypothetical protein Q4A07_09500, partial [Coriobacteriales bacterium]|nr:hypothetical protein [Coriobacteriales bacterium]
MRTETKRMLSLFMSAMLVLSLVPVSALAEAVDEATQVTSAEVYGALDNAQASESAAADAAGEGTPVADYEKNATQSESDAESKLTEAENTVTGANAQMSELSGQASEAQDSAEQYAQSAQDAATNADDSYDVTQQALSAAQAAETKYEATQAADVAQTAANTAADAVANAYVAATAANQKAQEAEEAYNQAQQAYDEAKAKADGLLAQGKMSAKEAEAYTAEALRLAQMYRNAMVAAQQEAESISREADEASQQADEELKQATDALVKTIAETGADVAQKTATTVVTGAALAATKLAAEAAQLTRDSYAQQLGDLQSSVEDLQQKIEDADAAIKQAQEDLESLDAEDGEYAQAVKALEDAQAAKDAAQTILNNAQAILEARQAEAGAKAQENLDAIQSGTATNEQKKEFVRYVVDNIDLYVSREEDAPAISFGAWEDEEQSILSVSEGDAQTYYKVKTNAPSEEGATDGSVELVEVKKVAGVEVFSLPDNPQTVYAQGDEISGILWNGYRTTNYTVMDSDGNKYTIYVYEEKENVGSIFKPKYEYHYKYKAVAPGVISSVLPAYDVTINADGSIVLTRLLSSDVMVAAITDVTGFHFEDADDAKQLASSNNVSDAWQKAQNAEQNLNQAQQELENQQAAYDEAKQTYDNAKAALNQLIDSATSQKELDEAQKKQLETQIKELDNKLNGNLAEQLIRDLVAGDANASLSASAQIAKIWAKVKIGLASDEERQELEYLTDGLERGNQIMELLGSLASDGVTVDSVTAIAKMLTGDGLSAETKLLVAKTLDSLADKAHATAVEDLRQAAENAQDKISEATKDEAKAVAKALEKKVVAATAEAMKSLATALAADAEQQLVAAKKANEDAQKAAMLYEQLVGQFGVDDSEVQAAKAAAQKAAQLAADAEAAYQKAKEAAEKAQKDAEEAAAIAGQKVDPTTTPEPTPSPTPEPTSTPAPPPTPTPTPQPQPGNGNSQMTALESYANRINTVLSNTQVTGQSIAAYAMSLKGDKYAEVVNNDTEMLKNGKFVEYVYGVFNIKVDANNTDPSQIAQDANGSVANKGEIESGDVLCV